MSPTNPITHHARCNCGAVHLTMAGPPKRVGLCHCRTCRKATGSPFLSIAVWNKHDVTITGVTKAWKETVYNRHFCPTCGSAVYGAEDDDQNEIDVHIGVLDTVPSPLTPSYELWISRRETWLEPLPDAAQHERNRPD